MVPEYYTDMFCFFATAADEFPHEVQTTKILAYLQINVKCGSSDPEKQLKYNMVSILKVFCFMHLSIRIISDR